MAKQKEEQKKSFIVYEDWQRALDLFDESVQNEVRKAIFYNGIGREIPKLSPLSEGVFALIKLQMDDNQTKREEKIAKLQENGGKGGRPKIKNNQMVSEEPNGNQNNQMVSEEPNGKNKTLNVNINVNDTQYKCEYIEELSKNQQWQEQICMNHHITIDEVKDWLSRFELDIGCNGTVHHTLKDAMSHFNAWLKKELKNQNKTTNGNKTGRRVIAHGEVKDYGSSF